MSIETEEQFRKRSHEREPLREQKETKEAEANEELKRAAAMERADYLAKEVKQSKQQIQNILLHMQQVLAAIQALRDELNLSVSEDASSVAEDKKRVAALRKKINEHQKEIQTMREDLIREQVAQLKEEGAGGGLDVLRARAENMVDNLIGRTANAA